MIISHDVTASQLLSLPSSYARAIPERKKTFLLLAMMEARKSDGKTAHPLLRSSGAMKIKLN